MARGRLFSRKYEQPAKPVPPEELEKSPNPLVQLGITFKRLQKLAPEPHSSPTSKDNSRRPLVDIHDVQQYLRAKLGISKQISTIPLPHPSSTPPHPNLRSQTIPSETTHVTSKHSYSSDASSLPSHDATPVSRVFDIGTVGHHVLEANEPHQTTFSSSDQEPDQEPASFKPLGKASFKPSGKASFKPSGRASSKPSAGRRGQQSTTTTLEVSDEGGASARLEVKESLENPSTIILDVEDHAYTWVVEPPSSASMPHLDMRDVQEFVRGVVEVCTRFENWGMPQTSWENKMPWHSPPPEILARGLERPPERFASEEERLAFNRRARKRKPFLTGCPPTWSFMIANLALIGFLVYNPLG